LQNIYIFFLKIIFINFFFFNLNNFFPDPHQKFLAMGWQPLVFFKF